MIYEPRTWLCWICGYPNLDRPELERMLAEDETIWNALTSEAGEKKPNELNLNMRFKRFH